jgi:molybdopterin synthase catalytic subunit
MPDDRSGVGPFFRITNEALDARRVEATVTHPGAGAICSFTGIVRDNSGGHPATHLEYEAYTDMAEAEMRRIAAEVGERWPAARIAMSHRVGCLEIGEASVVVSVSAPQRAEAFAACKWAMDELKVRVPVWKKEFTPEGAFWIEGPQTRPA